MEENELRTPYFKKDDDLENALSALNHYLEDPNFRLTEFESNRPMIMIMGCARSGSTLLLQWLASLGIFSYPSNLIARFYGNPYVGILAQQSLLEHDPLNQLGFTKPEERFDSNLGKTIGPLNPSEFWYFWRRFFSFEQNAQLLTGDADWISFFNELAAFEYLTKKPLVLKGLMLNWHIPELFNANKNILFIDLVRDPFYNAQSLILAREKYYNNRDQWYSFKPPEYAMLKSESPIDQVAGQVIFTQKAVEQGLQAVPDKNKVTIRYEEFCNDPKATLKMIDAKWRELGSNPLPEVGESQMDKKFTSSNTLRLNESDRQLLTTALSRYNNL